MPADQSLFLPVALGMEKGVFFVSVIILDIFPTMVAFKTLGMDDKGADPEIFPSEGFVTKTTLGSLCTWGKC